MVVLLLFLSALSFYNVQGNVGPLVQTNQGLIRGLQADDGDYSMFLGIPFGKVQEDNPFGPALPHPKFEQVFNAYDDSAICPQREEFNRTITGTLDCLHLHIYVPNKASPKNKVPVLAWIYGGGFNVGFAGRFLYGPQFLVRHDIILVSINYRLGPYGFMCLDTPEVPGNQGLKDQLLALRWIKDNIDAFGGDVNKITIMGESAGSVSVELHLMSEQEKLFNQIIMQSTSALSPLAEPFSDKTAPLKIAEKLGYKTTDLSDALKFLAKIDPKAIIAASIDLSLLFVTCVEKRFDGVESLISVHPLHADIPKAKNTKVLAGFNNKEQLVQAATRSADAFKNLNIFQLLAMGFNVDEDFQVMEDIVRRFYIGDEEVTELLRWKIMEFESDWFFNYPMQWAVTNYLEKGVQEVYQYMFSYSGGRNFFKNRNNVTEVGAAHADELGYLFDLSFYKSHSDEDQRMIDQITTLWANFVKYGDPTPETSDLIPVKWPPVTKDVYSYMDIDSELSVKRRAYHDRLSFMQLFYKTNWNRLKGNSQN
ncbi:juvenile hormone esterase [Bicyclus anynana]|uniref:Carboxylic ester hydrolase n=1 Tax=Bicyclus anynana TaxID=110368 RepID=A0A6J1N1B8_BICAN|nr:juvenile hormone esterase [Bicyclus anynana]